MKTKDIFFPPHPRAREEGVAGRLTTESAPRSGGPVPLAAEQLSQVVGGLSPVGGWSESFAIPTGGWDS